MRKLLVLALALALITIACTGTFGVEYEKNLPSKTVEESWRFTDTEIKGILIAHLEANGQKIVNKKEAYNHWCCNCLDFENREKSITLLITHKIGETNTEIICIIDKSGSMSSVKNDVIGGFNTFIEEQKKIEGCAVLTFILFDTKYKIVHENKPLNDIPILDNTTYQPRGSTALLDAIGITIDNAGRRLSNMSKQNHPDKVIVVILTDGEENSSHQYNLSKIKEMITHQKNVYKWEFIFLGANQDAFAEAMKIGIDAKDSFGFQPTSIGISDAYTTINTTVSNYRNNQDGNMTAQDENACSPD